MAGEFQDKTEGSKGWKETIPVHIASAKAGSQADGSNVTLGTKADAPYTDTDGSDAGSVVSILKGVFVNLLAWFTPATMVHGNVVLNGAKQTAVAAGSGKHKVFIRNPIGNHDVAIGLANDNLASASEGWTLPSGGVLILDPGITNAITCFGTNGETLIVYAG